MFGSLFAGTTRAQCEDARRESDERRKPVTDPLYGELDVALAAKLFLDGGVPLMAKMYVDGAPVRSGWMMRSVGRFAAKYYTADAHGRFLNFNDEPKAVLRLSLANFTAQHNAAICC